MKDQSNVFEELLGYLPEDTKQEMDRFNDMLRNAAKMGKSFYDDVVKEDKEKVATKEMVDDIVDTTPLDTKTVHDYIYDEPKYLARARAHIDSTYETHYAGETQPTELIIDSGNGVGFCIGSIIKYASRLGKKDGWNVEDVYKIIHYAVILLFILDKKNPKGN